MTQNIQTEMEYVTIAKDVLVVGGGLAGTKTASKIADLGYPVTLVAEGAKAGVAAETTPMPGMTAEELEQLSAFESSDKVDVMLDTQLNAACGVGGDFIVQLQNGSQTQEKTVGAIVVAPSLACTPLNAELGVSLASNVITQSQMEEALEKGGDAFAGKTIAFTAGLAQNGNPLVLERALKSVLKAKETGDCTVFLFADDLKVAGDGLERMSLEVRDKGVIYVKLSEVPAISQSGESLTINYRDPVLRREIELTPDILVVEEALGAGEGNAQLAKALGIDVGSLGFLQTDNVHRYPVDTNREGIFVVGGGRTAKSVKLSLIDAENAALKVHELLGEGQVEVPSGKAVLDTGKCTFCLTCFRCCPHGAIYWEAENKPVISAVACQACGICASECPMDAIQIGGYSDTELKERAAIKDDAKILAFCCKNSAVEAGKMAEEFKMDLPEGLQLVEVPCAGKVDTDYLMNAFAEGADGVMVIACHNGNCKSEKGSLYAGWRANHVGQMLEEIGLEKERICYTTLAANMGADFAKAVNDMAAKIKAMG